MAKTHFFNKTISDFLDIRQVLRELIQYKSKSRQRFAQMIVQATNHIRSFSVQYEHGNKVGAGQLFYNIEADKVTGDVTVSVNNKVLGVLNDLTNNFTMFLQPDWAKLNSKYAQMIYLMVMQWRTTDRDIVIPMEDFKNKLQIPDSMTTSQITKRIIKPVVQTMNDDDLLQNFMITPIKRGRKYIAYRISFDAMPKLNHATKEQAARIGRLADVAEAKSNEGDTPYDKRIREIMADAKLTKWEAKEKVEALKKSRPHRKIPLFKIGEDQPN